MTHEQLLATLERWVFPSFTFYGTPEAQKQEKTDYASTIYGLCSSIHGLHFDECAKHLMKNWKTAQKPKAGHFYSAYRYLGDMKGWGQKESKECSTCRGTNYVYVWVMDEQGRQYQSMIGCGVCNEKFAHLSRGLVLAEAPPPNRLNVADLKLHPRMAKSLWKIAENNNLKLPDDLFAKILELANQPDPDLERIRRAQEAAAREAHAERVRQQANEALKTNDVPDGDRTVEATPLPSPAAAEESRRHLPTKPVAISAEDAAAMDMPF
jgi:hypothetical protein